MKELLVQAKQAAGVAGDKVSGVRDSIFHRLDTADGHIGRAYKYPRLVSDWLAAKDWVTPNRITALTGAIGTVGSAISAEPAEFSRILKERSNGSVDISEKNLKLLGLLGVAIGYAGDGLDGSVAKAKEELGREGYTKLGRVLDGFFDKMLENAGPLAILHFASESKMEKPSWFLYTYFSNLTTLIRSVGVAHGIDIDKTGSGSRGDIEGAFLFGHAVSSPFIMKREKMGSEDPFWRGKGSHGTIMTAMRMRSAWNRWNVILQSGNTEAIEQVKKEFIEFTALNIAGYAIGEAIGIGGSNGQFAFGLAKTIDTIAKEPKAYGEGLRPVMKRNAGDVFDRVTQLAVRKISHLRHAA